LPRGAFLWEVQCLPITIGQIGLGGPENLKT
jgi:hypothetical protein